jgi:aminoglycoside/choline kinase family phosphotransferase
VYRDVLPSLDLEHPEVFAIEAEDDDVAFTILMEDVSQRPGVRVGSVLDPTTPDDVDRLLDSLARLHAAFWGRPERVGWATLPRDNAPMRFWREIGPRLTHTHLATGHRGALVDAARWPEAAWWPAFDRLVELDSTGPTTFLHGDVHAGNVYHVAGGAGGLLDWQLALQGCWALDVTYLVVTALSPDDRAAHERGLLDRYLERLRGHGIDPPSPDEAWLRYRQNVLYGIMMWLITPEGVHAEAAQAAFLGRCLVAAEDLETMDALRRSP